MDAGSCCLLELDSLRCEGVELYVRCRVILIDNIDMSIRAGFTRLEAVAQVQSAAGGQVVA
jgi:hypothetical protein